MRTGVFLPNWIGDVVMATPALRALRAQADQHGDQLIAVMKPYVADVVAGLDWFDDQLFTKQPDGESLTTALRAAELDRFVLLPHSFRSAWLAWRSGAKERVGMARDGRSLLLSTKVYHPRRGRKRIEGPLVDDYLRIAYAAGADFQPPTLELATTNEDEQQADQVWTDLRLPPGENVVVLNTGGAFGVAKNWPAEHFAKLAQQLVADGFHILVNCGPAERDVAREITNLASRDQVKSLADWPAANDWRVPIGLSKAVIRRSRLLVSTDSGPRFFGVAFGKPVVSLFGSMSPDPTRTHSPLETQLSLRLDCSPCMKSECPLGHHRCMRDLSVEMVYNAVSVAIGSPSQSVAA